MAKSQSVSFDDLPEVERSDDGDGSDWIDLDAGTEVAGTITGYSPNAGYNGVVEIDGRPMYLTRSMKNDLFAALVEGATMAVRVDDEEQTYENEDGEEKTYYDKTARFAPAGRTDE